MQTYFLFGYKSLQLSPALTVSFCKEEWIEIQ